MWQGRAPRPREIEINLLAYAPDFLGLAAAAATESDSSATDKPSNGATSAGFSARGKRKKGKGGKGGRRKGGGLVPTGLSETSVWPDEDGDKKKREMDAQLSPDKVRCVFCVDKCASLCNRCTRVVVFERFRLVSRG